MSSDICKFWTGKNSSCNNEDRCNYIHLTKEGFKTAVELKKNNSNKRVFTRICTPSVSNNCNNGECPYIHVEDDTRHNNEKNKANKAIRDNKFLKKELDDANEKIRQLEQDKENLLSVINKANKAIRDKKLLEKELDDANEKIRQLEQDNENLLSVINDTNRKLKRKCRIIKKLEERDQYNKQTIKNYREHNFRYNSVKRPLENPTSYLKIKRRI